MKNLFMTTEDAIDSVPMTARRCEELWLGRDIGCEIKPDAVEQQFIRRVWDTMHGGTCFMDAFFRIWHRKRELNDFCNLK